MAFLHPLKNAEIRPLYVHLDLAGDSILKEAVSSGRFSSKKEAVRHAISLLQRDLEAVA
jgi:Arc/MetJ-type ribon-helix-helix transcriptional regulator